MSLHKNLTLFVRNYKYLLKLIPSLCDLKPGDFAKSRVGGLMDLNLDVLERQENRLRIYSGSRNSDH